jgi:hypothetical protein
LKAKLLRWVPVLMAVCAAPSAMAGIYTDDLSKCLVSSTTKEDRISLVRWMFTAAAHHPAVKPIATISAAQQDDADKTMGMLLTRLLTESCRTETQKAVQYEGAGAFRSSFEVLGKVAGQELFTSPEVTASLTGLQKYVDEAKIRAVTSPPASAPAPK